MVYEKFKDFVEFKNTKEGKKVDLPQGKDMTLTFRKVKMGKYYSVRIGLNPSLVQSLKDNKIWGFKLLFNETNGNICLRYDNSSNCLTIVNKTSRPGGAHDFYNKYVTAVMLDLMKAKNAKSFVYKGKYYKDNLAYLFTLSKVNKE